MWTSLMVQRLGLWGCKGGASAAGDEDSIPGQGTKIPQASHMGGGGCQRHTHTWFAGLHPKYSDSVGLDGARRSAFLISS